MVYATTVVAPQQDKKENSKKSRSVAITLQVSGKLWNRNLVMRDTETGSLWSHMLGECMEGPLKGARLELIPGAMMTWKGWKERYPKTTVISLKRTAQRYEKKIYRIKADFLYGVVINGQAAAYPFDVLGERRAIDDTVAEQPILVTFDPETTRANAFSRRIGKKKKMRVLTFQWHAESGVLTDVETGTLWDPGSGRARKGKLKGQQLTMVPGLVSYTRVWKIFHPESRIAGAHDRSGAEDEKPGGDANP